MTHETILEALLESMTVMSESIAEASASGNRDLAMKMNRAVESLREAMIIDSFDQGIHALENGDVPGAEGMFRLAAEGGYVPAMCRLGFILSRKGDDAGARKWLGLAVEKGDRKAAELLEKAG